MSQVRKYYIPSGNEKIYVEITLTDKRPASAVVIAHGLRSYYPGFLNMFAKRLHEAGYITVKFHFLGTGKSSGKFENKTTTAMLQNYRDCLEFLKKQPEIEDIGIMGRSNAGSLAVISGPDARIKAYCFLAAPLHYSETMGGFVKNATIKGKYFYHPSFKRRHTKGPGRLPLDYIDDLKKYDDLLITNSKKMKAVIYFQSTEDEVYGKTKGPYDDWEKNLPEPKKMVLIKGGNHSFKGHKRYVIEETIKWFKKYLPT